MMEPMSFETSGKHVMIDVWGCDFKALNDFGSLAEKAKMGAEKAGMHVLSIAIVPFTPQGATIALILGESHLTVHSAPEHGYAAIDIFTCGNGEPERAADYLLEFLRPVKILAKWVERGSQPNNTESFAGTEAGISYAA